MIKQKGVSSFRYHAPSLCWECSKYSGGCSWSKSFKPIPGWDAEMTLLRLDKDRAHSTTISYQVYECPEFDRDCIYENKAYYWLDANKNAKRRGEYGEEIETSG